MLLKPARKPGTFLKGDPCINRTKPGPGRPPIWWKEVLSRHKPEAIDTIVRLMRTARLESVRLRAAQDVLDCLHGKPKQPIEPLRPVDTSGLSTEEMRRLMVCSPGFLEHQQTHKH